MFSSHHLINEAWLELGIKKTLLMQQNSSAPQNTASRMTKKPWTYFSLKQIHQHIKSGRQIPKSYLIPFNW